MSCSKNDFYLSLEKKKLRVRSEKKDFKKKKNRKIKNLISYYLNIKKAHLNLWA
jgi:hypothetical protein